MIKRMYWERGLITDRRIERSLARQNVCFVIIVHSQASICVCHISSLQEGVREEKKNVKLIFLSILRDGEGEGGKEGGRE